MTDQAALIRAFADYARTISRRYEITDVLYRLTDQVVEILAVDGAGVSIADQDGSLGFVTASDEHVARVEQRQLEARQGPCHDAFHSGDRVTSADLTAEDRWRAYASVAMEQGFRAVAGIPMMVGDQRIGALNLYARGPQEWPADELDLAQVLADMASGYIVNARTLTETERLAAQLQHALDSRVVIEQAKGILAERHGIDPNEAFERLRQQARNRNHKVPHVARAVVEGSLNL